MKLIAGLLALLLSTGAAMADWSSKVDTDPFSDEKVGLMVGTSNSGIGFGAKCWEGKPDGVTLMILTPVDYDRSADYKPIIEVKLRVDDGEVRTLMFAPTDANGSLMFVTEQSVEPLVMDVVNDIATAKRRIALSLENSQHQVAARGSTAAAKKFYDACGLKPSA